MNLEVGMYARTKEGFIAKIEYIDKETGGIDCDSSVKTMYEVHYSCLWGSEVEELVVKASHNIIDLIEVGDYVNGQVVTQIIPNNRKIEPSTMIYTGTNYFVGLYNETIETIVTKEQFESMSYEVGD